MSRKTASFTPAAAVLPGNRGKQLAVSSRSKQVRSPGPSTAARMPSASLETNFADESRRRDFLKKYNAASDSAVSYQNRKYDRKIYNSYQEAITYAYYKASNNLESYIKKYDRALTNQELYELYQKSKDIDIETVRGLLATIKAKKLVKSNRREIAKMPDYYKWMLNGLESVLKLQPNLGLLEELKKWDPETGKPKNPKKGPRKNTP